MSLLQKKTTELQYIIFELTSKCNLSCKYCYNHWKNPLLETEGFESDYSKALKTLKRLFRQANVKHVTFTGGEPLLIERIAELVLFCRMNGASVSIISNGNAGGEQLFSQLVQLGVSLFEFPVHSATAKAHDSMTNKIGTWEKSVSTIQKVRALGGIVVPVIVVTKFNFSELDQTLEFLNRMGLKRIMINRYNIGGLGIKSEKEILCSKEELNEAFKQANSAAKALGLQVSSNVCTPHCVVNPKHYPSIAFSNCSPEISKRPLTLNASGELRFCNHSPSVLGNIFAQSISTILNTQRNQLWGNITPAYCTDCDLFEKCQGGCRAAAEQNGGSFNEVDPLVKLNETHEKSMVLSTTNAHESL